MGFTFAGIDSTAAALTWTLYELIQHHTIADRIRDEVQRQNPHDKPWDMSSIQKLDYLHWVVIEALRLHPPTPEGFRIAVNDDILPGGTRVPAGARVMFSVTQSIEAALCGNFLSCLIPIDTNTKNLLLSSLLASMLAQEVVPVDQWP